MQDFIDIIGCSNSILILFFNTKNNILYNGLISIPFLDRDLNFFCLKIRYR